MILSFQSKNKVYLSICLCCLQFLSSASYSFWHTGLLPPLGKFIPRYFILFDAVVNGIVSLISLSDVLLLVYSNARDFCVLILYPATLLNLLMTSSSFQTILQRYSNQKSMVLAQQQIYRSMEHDRKPRNKPTHLWSINLWQRRKEYTMEKRQSLQ